MDITTSGGRVIRIPPEILDHVFASSHYARDIDTVLCWSHVCRIWRVLALQQYAYAQDVVWNYHKTKHWSHRLPDAAFLRHRLHVSAKPLEFDIFITDDDPAFVYDTLLPALSRELHRVRTLRVSFARSAFPRVMRALVQPAPVLRDLRLSLNASSGGTLVLAPPKDRLLLGGHAPLLVYLWLGGMELPASSTPAFSSLQHVSFEFSIGLKWRVPHNLLRLSPRPRHLSLSISTVDMSALVPPAFPLSLESMSLLSDNKPVQLMSKLVSSKTPYIQCSVFRASNSTLVVPYLLQQLPSGALGVIFDFWSISDGYVDLCVHHLESNLRRSVVFEGHWTPYTYRHTFPPALNALITELTVEANLFGVMAALFPSLPALHSLVLTGNMSLSDDDEDDVWPTGTEEQPPTLPTSHGSIQCGSLSKLVLAATTDLTEFLGVYSLVAFVEVALGQTGRAALELELRNVMLYGEASCLLGMFSRIVTVPHAGAFEQPDLRGERFRAY